MGDTPLQERLRRLYRRVAALRDPSLHGGVFARHISDSAAAALVDEIDWLLRRATSSRADLLYAAFVDYVLADEARPYDQREALYRAAREAGADGVAWLLLDPPPLRQSGTWAGDPDPELLDRTLGERKWMARKPDRHLLQRLMRVTEPDVIRLLLRNPRMTEPDVVWLAARRPNSEGVLSEVARSRRWRSKARVRLALVQNPYTRPNVAVLQCPLLTVPDLRAVAEDNALHPLLLEMARHLVAERTRPAPEPAEIIPFPAGDAGEGER